jgi:hypothetical protein
MRGDFHSTFADLGRMPTASLTITSGGRERSARMGFAAGTTNDPAKELCKGCASRQGLRIESFFPMDDETPDTFRRWSVSAPEPTWKVMF